MKSPFFEFKVIPHSEDEFDLPSGCGISADRLDEIVVELQKILTDTKTDKGIDMGSIVRRFLTEVPETQGELVFCAFQAGMKVQYISAKSNPGRDHNNPFAGALSGMFQSMFDNLRKRKTNRKFLKKWYHLNVSSTNSQRPTSTTR